MGSRQFQASLGRTKLVKVLYYVDFDHYEKRPVSHPGAVSENSPTVPIQTNREGH